MMERDERLLPLPKEIQTVGGHDGPANYAPVYDDETFSDKRSYREYFLIVYKRLPLIIALSAIVTSAVAFYMYRQPSVYDAKSTLLIEPKRQKATSKDTVNINFVQDYNYLNTQIKLLQSPDLMKEVVIDTGVYRDPNLLANQNKSFFGLIRSMFSGGKDAENAQAPLPVLSESTEETVIPTETSLTPEEKRRVDSYSAVFLGSLNVLPEDKTNIVNLRVTTTNPDLSVKIADATAETFIKQNTRREMQGTQKSLQDLTKSIEELQNTIAQQEQERIAAMKQTGLPLAENGQQLAASILQQKSTEWLNAEAERRKTQQEYEAAVQAARKGEILAFANDRSFINTAREQQLKLNADLERRIDEIDKQIKDAETEKAALLVKYTDEHPKVKEIVAKIQTLSKTKETVSKDVSGKIDKEGKSLEAKAEKETLTGLQAKYQSAVKREQQAKSSYFSEVALANQQGQDAARLTTLTQTIEGSRNLLNTYSQRQKEYELALSNSRPDNISISAYAIKNPEPVGPQRNRNIIIAFLVSLAAGIGLAFLIDYLDDSVRTSDDIGRHVGLPTLAMIPHTALSDKKRTAAPALTTGKGGSSTALITLEDNRSAMAEAYRHLRTSLLFSSAGKPPQTILVTSSQPSEGKTTTAINTAITLAQSGAEVVLIDCDLRRPRLHHHFSLPNMTGLTNYLSGDKNTENLIKTYPGLPKLKVITSGPIPPNPTELLSSNEMKNLLQFLKTNFKHIVIDTPPAISFTDAAIISMLVDGVILVAMAGKSSIHLMRRFKQRLSGIGARIYGVVLNGIKPNSLEYGYYGYGYTYSYYDAPDDDSTPRMEEDEEETASIHATKG